MRTLVSGLAALAGLVATAGLVACASPADAAPRLDPVGTFDAPTYVTSPAGDGRLFVTERAGTIRIVGRDGAKRPTPFADLSALTTTDGERGLLSMAFPPDYATSGLVYVFITARDGAVQIRELRRSATDPNRVEAGGGRLVLAQEHAAFPNHNGGQLQFRPDGTLYAGFGDGGSGNDPNANGQKLSTLLGKLIRIDPRQSGAEAYTVPGDNPFVGRAGARPEIFSYGLRNPYRFSFDRSTGDLWIGDVGQGAREEVDFSPVSQGAGRGANFGWRCYEGKIRTPNGSASLCSDAEADYPHVDPLLDRAHPAVSSITGGYVVRDPGLPTLVGRYLHGDLTDPVIRAVQGSNAGSDIATGVRVSTLVSFGEDACGRVYTVSLEGPVSRLRDAAVTPCDLPEAPVAGSGGSTPAPTPTPGAGGFAMPTGTGACGLVVRRDSRQRLAKLRLAVSTRTRCTVRATIRVKGIATLRSSTRTVSAGRTIRVVVKRRGNAGARLRRAVGRRSRAATLTVVARNPAGKSQTVRRRVRILR